MDTEIDTDTECLVCLSAELVGLGGGSDVPTKTINRKKNTTVLTVYEYCTSTTRIRAADTTRTAIENAPPPRNHATRPADGKNAVVTPVATFTHIAYDTGPGTI